MEQARLAELERGSQKRRTRREVCLEKMDALIPWGSGVQSEKDGSSTRIAPFTRRIPFSRSLSSSTRNGSCATLIPGAAPNKVTHGNCPIMAGVRDHPAFSSGNRRAVYPRTLTSN